ncbi:MAG: hypothetical protein NTV38_09770 [Chloroflexi bacterium]|nr:hypothetical protein [Chloroflexota bacterium]
MSKMMSPLEGYFDGKEGKSSKRLQSFLGLLAALVFPLVAGLLKLKLPIAEITTGFLIYSAGMQGVSVWQESKK